MKVAILVIDMLNDFITGKRMIKQAKEIVPRIRELLEHARRLGLPVIYAKDAHVPGVDKEFELWGEHAVAGTPGADVVPELKPAKGDFVVEKRRYSAFFQTDLDLLLRELGVKRIVLVGVATDVCVQHTAADAFFRGYQIVIVKDCVSATNEQANDRSIEYMRKVYGASLKTLNELLEELSQ